MVPYPESQIGAGGDFLEPVQLVPDISLQQNQCHQLITGSALRTQTIYSLKVRDGFIYNSSPPLSLGQSESVKFVDTQICDSLQINGCYGAEPQKSQKPNFYYLKELGIN